ncbi:neuraminidase-like domain-containing protein [Lacibacter sp.]|uniref:Tc toxin subunit A-related protein n=1 Tax=Lacibacter sp. TaxID=1915409 RepID=UPI002B4B5541|nr:neuraminidase-like domain-containing protein [Lacibacter sp.]HLP37239.1 neuraminidase-like domain-containing protein [Lacibacter sp.]
MTTVIKIQHSVLGKVTDPNGHPLPNLKVAIYDVDMREWNLLSEDVTSKEGKYEFTWTHDQLSGRGKKTADIAVKVFTKEKNIELFSSSINEVRFNASDREEINITIREAIPKEGIEFDLLVKQISFLAGKVAIADLQENNEHGDVSFLSKEMEVAADKIEHLIVAHRLEKICKIDAGFFYALLRQNTLLNNEFSKNFNARLAIGIGVDLQTLLYDAALTDAKIIKAEINIAGEEKIISAAIVKQVNRYVELLTQYKNKATQYYEKEHPQKIVNLLADFFKEDKLQHIHELFTANKNDLNSFFDKLSDPAFYASKEKGKAAKTHIELGKLFGFGNTIIPQIAKAKGIKKPKDIRRLAKLNKTEWVKEISNTKHAIKDKKVIDSFASSIVRRMETEFPTLAFSAQLEREKKTVLKNQDKILSFFNKHEDFDMMNHNVDLFLKEKKIATKEKEAITEELKSLQRIFKLVPHYKKTLALREEKIHSSYSIVSIGETRFVKEVAPKAGIEEREATEIYRKAESKHTAAMLMVGDLQDSMSVIDIASFETTALAKKLEAVSKDFPNLKSLFKLVDSCECEHCRSVYSPAAYLVELLQFLGKRATFSIPHPFKFSGILTHDATTTGIISNDLLAAMTNEGYTLSPTARITASASSQTRFEIRDNGQLFIIDKIGVNNYSIFDYQLSDAKAELFSRRPELGEIDLGCANANTPVKYIDLVCEILEEAVSPAPGINYSGALASGADPLKGKISNGLLTTLQNEKFKVTADALIFETESSTTKPHYLRDKGIVCKIENTGGNNYKVYRLRQTFGTAAELDAAPEYVNELAYKELNKKSFAFKLPFDLAHTEAKAYLNRFGIDRAELMSAFQDGTNPANNSIAAERLGLTDAERNIIANSPVPNDNAAQQIYWNVPAPGNVIDHLRQVDHFLDRTGLTYKELELLLKLKFIDTNENLFIKHNDLSCDTVQKEIANLDLDALDRIHRFLRLQKKTGWKYEILDEIISQPNLGAGNLNDDCLIKAAQLKDIAEKTSIKLEELIGCFGVIPYLILQEDGPKPLYQQLFLNKARNGIIDENLLPEKVNGSQTITTNIGYLATCLQLKVKDLAFIKPLLPDDQLSFSNLSFLVAASRLLKKLKLKAEDFAIIQKLSGTPISSSPLETLAFIKLVEVHQHSTLKATDLKFILNHEASNLIDREIKVEKIEELLSKLKSEYSKIKIEQQSKFDSKLSAAEQKETFLAVLAGMDGIAEADAKVIVEFIDRDWKAVSDATGAKTFIDNKFDDGINRTTINTAIDALFIIDDSQKQQAIQDYEAAALVLKAAYDELHLANLAESNAITPIEIAAAAALKTTAKNKITAAETELELVRAPYNIATGRDLLKAFLDSIADFQQAVSKRASLEQTLATAFKADLALTGIVIRYAKLNPGTDQISTLLLDNFENPIIPGNYAKQYAAIRLLHKMFVLLNTFNISNTDAEWYFVNTSNPVLKWFEFDSLPYEPGQTAIELKKYLAFCKIVSYTKQYRAVTNPIDAVNPISFLSIVELILPGAAADRDEFLNKLALLTGYEKTDLDAIDSYLFAGDITKYKEAESWRRLLDCAALARKLGASVEQIKLYISPVLTIAEASDLRAVLKSRYDENTWLSTLKEIMDAIRPQKRNALVAYLLATNPGMKDENDLYEYFLVDVEMEACMPSSRIVLAHNGIQLFVQRCLMGLEPNAIADVDKDPNWNQWKWMKNYRTWEVNCKIFLYPENWYDVSLTDNKTYLLSEFISEIQQNELTNDTAEEAVKKYLQKLDDIAFLEVMATWYDVPTRDMHVFGRTKGGDPSVYYYRRFENERYWTPWEKVDLDITGDHLLAFKRNGRLNLAWPLFSEVAEELSTIPIPSSAPGTQVEANPKKKLKIQLAISEYSNKKWQAKKVSREGIHTPGNYITATSLPKKEEYSLRYSQTTDQVFLFRDLKENYYIQVNGIFDIAGCKGYPELVFEGNAAFPDFYPDFKDASLRSQRYFEKPLDLKDPIRISPDDLAVKNGRSPFAFYEVLNKTQGKFRISYPHQFTPIDGVALIYQYFLSIINKDRNQLKLPLGTLLPYFKEDSKHAYVIIPGFYKREFDRGEFVTTYTLTDAEKRTASNAFQLIEDVVKWYKKIKFEFQLTPPTDLNAALKYILTDTDFQDILKELSKYADLDVFLNLLVGRSGDPSVDNFLRELIQDVPLKYGEQFKNMYHPLVCALRSILYKDGIPALMKRETQLQVTNFDFKTHYVPHPLIVPQTRIKNPDGTQTLSYPIEDVDFESDGSYSVYNWDLFFRLPLHIAGSLTRNQRFEEALTWFHYMFNPTGALPGNGVQKYWVTKPFYLNQETDYINQRIDSLLYATANLSNPTIKELEFAIEEWRNKPYRPDVVARFRPVAYQKALLMKYIDNLTEWGDHLFRQDTMESIAQATQLYILADKLLGPKPRIIPAAIKQPYETYNQLEAKIDSFGNALVELENILPDLSVLPEGGNELPASPASLSMLYFCIPANDKMFEYWNRVADRLFKIRHCQNIDGVERSLALFAPPLDPDMLIRAAASGLDLSAVLAGMNAPTPYYRFNVLSQKATELTQEVRGLGSSLLSALEKKDAEALSLLKNELELKVLTAVKDIKILQLNESKEQIEVLNRTKKVTEEKQRYYSSIEKISSKEQLNLDKLELAHDLQLAAQLSQTLAGVFALIPSAAIGAAGFGGSPHATMKWGGFNLSSAAKSTADTINIFSSIASYQASRAATLGGYNRRFEDWKLQERLATKELASIDKQIAAAEIKKEIAENELKNHELQIDNSKKTDEFMRTKFSNIELYDWMIGQISAVYFKSYQLAHDIAKKAERCYRFELGNDDSFINYGYWDSMKKGLQSADHLLHDIKRMETGYMDKNKREYEITKHVSLALLDPLALVRLRQTGICDFEIPEVLYDMDHPGQYFRRLRSVSVSLPCIAGPYTSVSAKLSLVSNKYRKNMNPDNAAATGYAEDIGNDERFVYNVGAIQSIATSNAQNDSGVFELNFRDERYLPFENTGAISTWRLELPTEVKQFDYDTISDVVLHVKYTAREGGSGLKTIANAVLRDQLQLINQRLGETGLHALLHLKHDLPNEWLLFKKNATVNLTLNKSRLPYLVQSIETTEIDSVMFLAKLNDGSASAFTITVDTVDTNLAKLDELNLYKGINSAISMDTSFNLLVTAADALKLEELLLVVKYKF